MRGMPGLFWFSLLFIVPLPEVPVPMGADAPFPVPVPSPVVSGNVLSVLFVVRSVVSPVSVLLSPAPVMSVPVSVPVPVES